MAKIERETELSWVVHFMDAGRSLKREEHVASPNNDQDLGRQGDALGADIILVVSPKGETTEIHKDSDGTWNRVEPC